jgi:hypothetical protein
MARHWRRAAGPPPEGPLALARSRRLRQSGRAVLLWALGAYLLAQLTLTPLMDLRPWTSFEVVRQVKWKRLRQLAAREPDRPLLLMLGSSRTEIAFQAGELNGMAGPDGRPMRAYNFGLPGTCALHDQLHLREMLDAGIRPRVLLVEFLPPLLNAPGRGIASEEQWTWAPRLNVTQLVRLLPYFEHPGTKAGEWLEARLAPWYVFRPHLATFVRDTLHPEQAEVLAPQHDVWGSQTSNPDLAKPPAYRVWKAYDMYFASLQRLRVGDGPARALRDLLERCRQEGIPVVLVQMPESTWFRSWYRAEGLAESRRLLAELRATYGVDVIDATEWAADTDFTDGHHLMPHGAAAFTARLREELRPILARAGGPGG